MSNSIEKHNYTIISKDKGVIQSLYAYFVNVTRYAASPDQWPIDFYTEPTTVQGYWGFSVEAPSFNPICFIDYINNAGLLKELNKATVLHHGYIGDLSIVDQFSSVPTLHAIGTYCPMEINENAAACSIPFEDMCRRTCVEVPLYAKCDTEWVICVRSSSGHSIVQKDGSLANRISSAKRFATKVEAELAAPTSSSFKTKAMSLREACEYIGLDCYVTSKGVRVSTYFTKRGTIHRFSDDSFRLAGDVTLAFVSFREALREAYNYSILKNSLNSFTLELLRNSF